MNKRSETILNGPLYKVLWRLGLPIMAGNLIQTLYNLTDTYFVSKLGTTQLAAMQITYSLIFLMISLGAGLSVGGVALISQYIGAKKQKEAASVAGQLLTASILGSIGVAILGFFLTKYILMLMNARGDLLHYGTTYLRLMFLGAPTLFITFAFNGIKQGEGDTLTPMIVSGLSVILNIILDPIFIFTFDMGIAGAAYATILSRGLFNLVAIYILFADRFNTIGLRLKDLRIHAEYMRSIVQVGMPSAIGQSTTALGFTVLNGFILTYGEAIVTAFSIGNRINSLIFLPAMGISGALSSVVGQNLGANQIPRANRAFWISVGYSILIMTVTSVPIYIYAESMIRVFSRDRYIISEGANYLRILLVTMPFFGLFMSLMGLFQGSGHTVSAMIISMGRLWAIRIPMILLLKFFNMNEAIYIWYAMVISNIIIVAIGMGMYATGHWKKPVIKHHT